MSHESGFPIFLMCLLLTCIFGCVQRLRAQQVVLPLAPAGKTGYVVAVDSIRVEHHGGSVASLQMMLYLLGRGPSTGRITTLTPRLVSATDSVDLPAVRLYNSWAHFAEVRRGADADMPEDTRRFRAADVQEARPYAHVITPEPWMHTAALKFVVSEHDACGNVFATAETAPSPVTLPVDMPAAPAETPDTVTTVRPGDIRHFEGTAFIHFPVDRTDILPAYDDNEARLEEIRATIDSVLHNDRSTLQHITLQGFASPEGTYTHNEQLARGRVHSLRRYIAEHFDIPAEIISTTHEPEDWDGLRRYVIASDMPERDELLAIIDSSIHPDDKLTRIVRLHPRAYQKLLRDVFPYLRRTDYRVDYIARDEDEVLTTTSAPAAASADTLPPTSATPLPPVPRATDDAAGFQAYDARFAVKTNVLFDAALTPNIEVEVPVGRWSILAETWFPWFRTGHNVAGEASPYYRSDQRPTRNAYQLWVVGAELRYWLSPACQATRPTLAGTFAGVYAAGGKYDLEFRSEGWQGEVTSFGLTFGRSWPIARRWNIELSGSIGYVGGPLRHYEAEFDDARLIFRNTDHLHYVGPTKIKVGISYLIGKKK